MGKILSVDDSVLIRKIIGESVAVLDRETIEAENGKIALEILETNSEEIELIIMDWHMPEMNGYDALKAIKANEKFKNIPVMMVTTENEKERIIDAIKSGASSYMIKPFSITDLTSKIKQILGED